MRIKHLLSSDVKLKYWGYGEWVEEPDLVEFVHLGFDCQVRRLFVYETSEFLFGGHLCGYICIPEDHPWHGWELFGEPSDVHGGISFSNYDQDKFWIGFDCAHSGDIIPSLQVVKRSFNSRKIFNELNELEEDLKIKLQNSSFLKPTYKSINFAVEECKHLASHAYEAMKCEK